MQMRRRSVQIDVIRVVAMMAVVASHLWGSYDVVRALTFSWHVPIFFFLTGYLWTHGRSVSAEARSRARSLLVPFAAWMLLLGLAAIAYVSLRWGFTVAAIWPNVWGGALSGGVFASFWFLPVLFFVAVYVRAMERFPRWVVWAVTGVALAAFAVAGDVLALSPQGVALTFGCAVFTLAGQGFRVVQLLLPAQRPLALIGLAGSAVLLLTGLVRPLDMKLGDFGTPVVSVVVSIVICASLVTLATNAFHAAAPAWGPFVSEMARTSLVVLTTHSAWFVVLDIAGLPGVLVFTGALVLSWSLAIGLHRTPLSRMLVGIPGIGGWASRARAARVRRRR